MDRTNVLFALVTYACLACESTTNLVATDVFVANLGGVNTQPVPVTLPSGGSLRITLRSDTSLAEYNLTFTGLSSAATAAHIHGPAVDTALDTAVAGVLVDFALLPPGAKGSILLGPSGSATGNIDLRQAVTTSVSGDSLFALLHAGRLYADVHTSVFVDGEIRGQVRKK